MYHIFHVVYQNLHVQPLILLPIYFLCITLRFSLQQNHASALPVKWNICVFVWDKFGFLTLRFLEVNIWVNPFIWGSYDPRRSCSELCRNLTLCQTILFLPQRIKGYVITWSKSVQALGLLEVAQMCLEYRCDLQEVGTSSGHGS